MEPASSAGLLAGRTLPDATETTGAVGAGVAGEPGCDVGWAATSWPPLL